MDEAGCFWPIQIDIPYLADRRFVSEANVATLWLSSSQRKETYPPPSACQMVLLFCELSVENDLRGREIELFDVGAAFCGTVFAVHASVFPLHAERSAVPNIVECSDDLFKVDVPAANAFKVPIAFGFMEIDISAEDSRF